MSLKYINCSILVLFLIIGIPDSVFSEVQLGFKGGVAYSHQSFRLIRPESFDQSWYIGLEAGLFVSADLYHHISIRVGLDYTQRGFSEKYFDNNNLLNPTDTAIARNFVEYLSVPVVAQVFIPIRKTTIYFLAGPRIDRKIGSYTDFGVSPSYDEFNKSVLGGVVGTGFYYSLGESVQLLFETTYNFDISPAYNMEGFSIRNQSVNGLLGLVF